MTKHPTWKERWLPGPLDKIRQGSLIPGYEWTIDGICLKYIGNYLVLVYSKRPGGKFRSDENYEYIGERTNRSNYFLFNTVLRVRSYEERDEYIRQQYEAQRIREVEELHSLMYEAQTVLREHLNKPPKELPIDAATREVIRDAERIIERAS